MPTMRLSQRLWAAPRGDLWSMSWSATGRPAAPLRIRRGSRVPAYPVLQSSVWRSAAGRRTLDGPEGVEDVAPVLSARKPRSWWQVDRARGCQTVFLVRTRASGGRHSAPLGHLPEGYFRFDQDGCCRRPRGLSAGCGRTAGAGIAHGGLERPGAHPRGTSRTATPRGELGAAR